MYLLGWKEKITSGNWDESSSGWKTHLTKAKRGKVGSELATGVLESTRAIEFYLFLGARSSSSAELPEINWAELELGDPRAAELCLFLGARSSSSAELAEFDCAELELGDPRAAEHHLFQGARSSSSAKLPEFDWAELELGDPGFAFSTNEDC